MLSIVAYIWNLHIRIVQLYAYWTIDSFKQLIII